MRIYDVKTMRAHAREIFDTAVKAVNAEQCVRQFVSLDGDILHIGDQNYDLSVYRRILVVGTGKASPQMGVALEDNLGRSHLRRIYEYKIRACTALKTYRHRGMRPSRTR